MDNNINVAIISLGFIGDTLLTEPMCANIKKAFPHSNICFIVKEAFIDIPRGFASVDNVYGLNNNNRGLKGYFDFKKTLPPKHKFDYAIITHPHERSLIVAKLLGAKNIISLPVKKSILNIFINKKRKYIEQEIRNTYKADYNNGYLKSMCDYTSLPVQYSREDLNVQEIKAKYNIGEDYIILSPTSKDAVKDWDYENVKNFIINAPQPVILIGTDKANSIASKLIQENISFIDLTKKTTVAEMGVLIKNAKCCVSVDTGTLHLSYVQNVKTIGLFFNEKMIIEWTPQNNDNLKLLIGKKYFKDDKIICEKNIDYQDVLKEL